MFVVAITIAQFIEIEFVIDQIAQRMLETTGDNLLGKVDRQQHQALLKRFESRHFRVPHRSRNECYYLIQARVFWFFYSLNAKLSGAQDDADNSSRH